MTQETAEGQQEKQGQEQHVPTTEDEDHQSEHEAPESEPHRAQRSSVQGPGEVADKMFSFMAA
jgi:hypothetical protein